MGAGGIKTGSKRVITLNLNRIAQDWYRSGHQESFKEYLTPIVERLHKYLKSWNQKLWDDYNAGILTVYSAGFISLDDEYLTCGCNGLLEAAEFLSQQTDTEYYGLKTKHDDVKYQQFVKDVFGTIKDLNIRDRSEHCKFNTEMIPKICGALVS